MKIGIASLLQKTCPDEREAIRRYAQMGFEAMDYGAFMKAKPDNVYLQDGWEDYARALKETADQNNIIFSQAHAPMYAWSNTPEEVALRDELTRRAFRVCELLGAPYLVIHPRMNPDCINGENAERDLLKNIEWYRTLLPFAEKHGVKIALENMFGWDPKVNRICKTTFSDMEEMLYCIEALDSEQVVVCLDTGHCNVVRTSPAIAARKLGRHLKLLHVHDNYGTRDDHLAPCFGNIDWDAFLDALIEIGYDGVFSSEASSMSGALPPEAAEAGAALIYTITDALLKRHGMR